MKPAFTKSAIAYPLLSYGILLLFAWYGIFTVVMLFIPKTTAQYLPRQAAVYHVFFVQNWHLFAQTKLYNRELNMIVSDSLTGQKDTIDLVHYSITQKRKHAPCNQYEDAIDHLLFFSMNQLEMRLTEKEQELKKADSLQPVAFYLQKSCMQVRQDSAGKRILQNFHQYGTYVLRQMNKPVAGKHIQFEILHRYIAPAQPPLGPFTVGNIQKVFE
jgi:hypothetical protein